MTGAAAREAKNRVSWNFSEKKEGPWTACPLLEQVLLRIHSCNADWGCGVVEMQQGAKADPDSGSGRAVASRLVYFSPLLLYAPCLLALTQLQGSGVTGWEERRARRETAILEPGLGQSWEARLHARQLLKGPVLSIEDSGKIK